MIVDQDESLIAHLEALRQTFIRCLIACGIGFIPMFLIAPLVLDALIHLLLGSYNITLNYFAPMEVFLLQIKIAFVLDLIICAPYIAYQIWQFILPALYETERCFIRSVVGFSAGLFGIGILFCLFFILPAVMRFGLSFSTDKIQAVLGVSNVITLALQLSVIFGLMFQFPLITFSLVYFNITSQKNISHKRPYVFMGILILSAFLTPPDIVSQLLLTIPTYLLFEGGLLAAGFIKKREKDKKKS